MKLLKKQDQRRLQMSDNPTDLIVKFNTDRRLAHFNPESELAMIKEEVQELSEAIQDNDEYGTIDALNDIRVLVTGALWKLGQDPEASTLETCKEILSRKGDFNLTTGKWEKDRDQDKSTLYKADYTKSKR